MPIVIALSSFVLSAYTFAINSRMPQVEIILPRQIRVAQGEQFGYAYVYFQPTFVHAGASTQVEVVRSARLEFAPVDGGDPVAFDWRESGRFAYDPATRSLNYVYEDDFAPLLLSRETAQSTLGTFFGPPGWYFTPGQWRATLTAERVKNQRPLAASFIFTLDEESVETLNTAGGTIFLPFELEATTP
jgi:hypothetical protein